VCGVEDLLCASQSMDGPPSAFDQQAIVYGLRAQVVSGPSAWASERWDVLSWVWWLNFIMTELFPDENHHDEIDFLHRRYLLSFWSRFLTVRLVH
jgi:hypothetical protein